MAKNTANKFDMNNWTPGPVTLFQAFGWTGKVNPPTLRAQLPGMSERAAIAGGAGAPSGNISTGGAKGIKGLYNALKSAGASHVQAIGLIANAMRESTLNPEARVMDSNGYYSNGLWQFNEASYPDSSALVTGNPAKDMIAQIQYLIQVGGLRAASGSTPEQAAGNFSANFEHCQGCQPNGSDWNIRVGNVAAVQQALGSN